MNQRIAHITLLVDSYDEAINFYVNKLHFELIEDTKISDSKRWVLVKPKGVEASCNLLLAEADSDLQQGRVGNQTGGRVALFLYTDDFERDYKNLVEHQIEVVRSPKQEPYGKVLVFKDLYGNLWDLIEPK